MQKKKMSEETKIKLIYSGELIIIAIVAIVIGALKLAGVMQTRPTRLLVYNIISIIGSAWLFFDLIWALASSRRRKRVCLSDKFMILPVAIYLFIFDIICFIDKAKDLTTDDVLVRISVGAVLIYIGVIYIYQGLYHYWKPVPQVIEAIEESIKVSEEKSIEASDSEINKQESEDNSK